MADTRYERRERPRPPTIDSRSLWTGGAATAVVAALVAVVGVLNAVLYLGAAIGILVNFAANQPRRSGPAVRP